MKRTTIIIFTILIFVFVFAYIVASASEPIYYNIEELSINPGFERMDVSQNPYADEGTHTLISKSSNSDSVRSGLKSVHIQLDSEQTTPISVYQLSAKDVLNVSSVDDLCRRGHAVRISGWFKEIDNLDGINLNLIIKKGEPGKNDPTRCDWTDETIYTLDTKSVYEDSWTHIEALFDFDSISLIPELTLPIGFDPETFTSVTVNADGTYNSGYRVMFSYSVNKTNTGLSSELYADEISVIDVDITNPKEKYANLFVDPDCENTNGVFSNVINTDIKRTGNGSLMYTPTSEHMDIMAMSTVQIDPLKRYRFSAWVKTSVPTNGIELEWLCRHYDSGAVNKYSIQINKVSSIALKETSEWQQISGYFEFDDLLEVSSYDDRSGAYTYTSKKAVEGDCYYGGSTYLTFSKLPTDREFDIYIDDVSIKELPSIPTDSCFFINSSVSDNQRMVSVDEPILLEYSQSLSQSIMSGIEVKLNGNTLTEKEYNITLTQPNIISINFGDTLRHNIQYALEVNGIKDLWGRELDAFNITFQTEDYYNVYSEIYKIVNGEKIIVDSLTNGDYIIETYIKNNVDNDLSVFCEAALFKDTDSATILLDVSDVVSVYNNDEHIKVTNSITINNLSENDCLKIFVWDSLDSLRPLCVPMYMSVQKAQYFVDDFFESASNDFGRPPSGWDADISGGTITKPGDLLLQDTSDTEAVSLERNIRNQAGGKFSFETRFIPLDMTDGLTISLMQNNTDAVCFITEEDYICIKQSANNERLVSYQANEQYGIKAEIDIDAKLVKVFINGSYIGEYPFASNAEYINKIKLSTSKVSESGFKVGFVKLYAGYLINEKFLSATETGMLDDWEVLKTDGSSVLISGNEKGRYGDYYSLKVNNSTTSDSVQLIKNFAYQDDKIASELKFHIKNKTNGINFALRDGSNTAFQVSVDFDDLKADGISFYEYSENLWYSLKMELDIRNHTANVYLNDKKLVENMALPQTILSIDNMCITISGTTEDVLIDDILVYRLLNEPSDYVPRPSPAASDGYYIGMQSCSLWREGYHIRGWDYILPYEERKPYLGYYDEGSEEVADWEIKWLAEHGVDFESFCWYTPAWLRAANEPIKDTVLYFGLSGYLKSKYSNMLKFSIMWELEGSKYSVITGQNAISDFRNCIVPYWVEYYLKDSRYMVIDNKPVISFYGYKSLLTSFGDVNGVKEQMDYLRQVCVNLGYDGAILLAVYSGSDQIEFENIKAMGFDGTYAYTWETWSWTADTQIASMSAQQTSNSTDLNVLPTVTMGINRLPWRGTYGQFVSPEDFKTTLSWAKDTFMTEAASDSLSSKLLMLGNWNEFGEGHYLMPSEVHGFDYLDAIRQVFTSNTEHTDLRPEANQLRRMSYLYPEGRMPKPIFESQPIPSKNDTLLYGIYFDDSSDLSKFNTNSNVGGVYIDNGILKGTSIGSDPSLTYNDDDLNIELNDKVYFKVRMKATTDTALNLASIYYITDKDSTWDENKSIKTLGYRSYNDIYFFGTNSEFFNSNLAKFRIDPFNCEGSFDIDSIEIYRSY